MVDDTVKKLPLLKILVSSWQYCREKAKTMALFTLVAYVVGAMALFSWKSLFFWPVLILMYVLWGGFFRYYLQRRPYFDLGALFNSLIPSTKIVVLSVIVSTILVVLPLLPLFLNISPEFNEKYALFLQGDFEHEGVLVLVASLLFMLVSPQIAYRPFLAWVSALAGRSGSLRFAWERTKGNYGAFLLIALITNLGLMLIRWCIWQLGGDDYITLIFAAPMITYFNIISAKAYEFFFLDVE